MVLLRKLHCNSNVKNNALRDVHLFVIWCSLSNTKFTGNPNLSTLDAVTVSRVTTTELVKSTSCCALELLSANRDCSFRCFAPCRVDC